MTLVVHDQSKEPGTHALLIGVGDYPHLKGGAAPEAERFKHHMEMGQLSSPPRSLGDVATWFCNSRDGFHNPDRPLRSLELLGSARDANFTWTAPNGVVHALDRASKAAVRQALIDWKERANRSPDNLCVLYFCGHGLSFGEAQNSLLLDDFGADENDPMASAIAFDELRLGMMLQCEARHQCYFIDACRTPPTRAFTDLYGFNAGDRVIAGALNRQLREKCAPVFFATRLAAAAYGLPDQASLFTQGMLRCFRGVGSRDADESWEVTVEAVAEGINKCVESLAFQAQPQYCQPRDTGQSFMLHRLRADPEVIVKIYTRDAQLLPTSILVHVCEATAQSVERPPLDAPWWLPVRLGQHTFKALSAADRQVVIGTRTKYVAPPSAEIGL